MSTRDHKRSISKVSDAPDGRTYGPAGGITFFTTHAKPKPRKIHPTSDAPTAGTPTNQPEDEAKKKAEAEKERKAKLFDDFVEKHGKPMQLQEDSGSIRFIKQAFPRFAPTYKWVQNGVTSRVQINDIIEATESGKSWVWAQLFGVATPELSHLKVLEDAMRRIEAIEPVEGFKAKDYTLSLAPKANGKFFPSIAIICDNDEARRRIFTTGSFSYHAEKDGELGVFIQAADSIGTAIILDFENAPSDPKQFLEGCWKLFRNVILLTKSEKEGKKGEPIPVEFKYGRVTRTTARDSKEDPRTDTWRVAFKADNKKIKDWTYPKTAGMNGSRGEV
ncbi:hypothetical protein M407DRAFT_30778 [Tulasnella calospora MUT 4182]|uniref:Uncharacterized protein n=1 Tax=Tulasnella calospora MUT 4182 TaxID=1051891 RepID=A0A0C3LDP3_9AGAM|nr:hypothetical protein M407DRAFT_30778 [Tulasnella calospora MUT 4182]